MSVRARRQTPRAGGRAARAAQGVVARAVPHSRPPPTSSGRSRNGHWNARQPHPFWFARSPRMTPKPVDQMTGWPCRQARVDGGWQQHKSGASPGGTRKLPGCLNRAQALFTRSGLPWESLSHRQVLAELATEGWVPCGVGVTRHLGWVALVSCWEMPEVSQVVQTRWITTGVLRSPAVSYIQASTELSDC